MKASGKQFVGSYLCCGLLVLACSPALWGQSHIVDKGGGVAYDVTRELVYYVKLSDLSPEKIAQLDSLGMQFDEAGLSLGRVSERQLDELRRRGLEPIIVDQAVLSTGRRHLDSPSPIAGPGKTACNEMYCYGSNNTNVNIPDNNTWVYSPISVSCSPVMATVTRINVSWQVYHPWWADLDIDLNDDDQTFNEDLWSNGSGSGWMIMTRNNIHTFDNAEVVNQEWDLWARDVATQDVGYIDYWAIEVYFDAPVENHYGWPCNPPGSQYPLTGTFDEARKSPSPHFHAGIDITPPNSHVYSVSSGVAVAGYLGADMATSASQFAADYEYVHLTNLQVSFPSWINCQKYVGDYVSSQGHMELRDGLNGAYVNPLHPTNGITPFFDDLDPVVEVPTLTRDGNPEQQISPGNVSGLIDIIAEIRDRIPLRPSGVYAPYKVGFEVVGHLSLAWRQVYDYWWNSGIWTAYAPSTQVDPPDPSTHFKYIVTNYAAGATPPPGNGYLNTALLPDGNYTLNVCAEDRGGRSNCRPLAITIHNGNDVQQIANEVPSTYALEQNYPNPFNPETRIRYQLPTTSNVVVRIHDVLGREVKTIVNREQQSGYYEATWDGKDEIGNAVSSGVYFCRIVAGGFVDVKSMVVVR